MDEETRNRVIAVGTAAVGLGWMLAVLVMAGGF